MVEKQQNGIIWLKLSKDHMFDSNHDVYICTVYIPPQASNVIDLNNFDFFENIEAGLEKYKSLGTCFVMGDLNSRTSNLQDVLGYDMYILIIYQFIK